MNTLVAKTKTNDHISAAVGKEMPLVAGEQISCIVAIDRRIGILIACEQLPELPGITVFHIANLGSTLSVADRGTEERNLVVRNIHALQ